MNKPTPPTKKRFRWGRLLLVVSLALNLLVVGVVVGEIAGDDHHRHGKRFDLLKFGPYAAALEQDQREVLKRELFADRKSWRETKRGLRQDLEQVTLALRATPFDAERVAALMAAPSQRVLAQSDRVQRRILELIAQMDDAERAAYADRLEKVIKRGPRGPRPEGRPQPDPSGAY